jgi:hypothetical protein
MAYTLQYVTAKLSERRVFRITYPSFLPGEEGREICTLLDDYTLKANAKNLDDCLGIVILSVQGTYLAY